MQNAFHEHEIVPKILPSLPGEVLGLTYNHGNKVQPGATIPRSDTLQPPFLHYSQPGEYLVVMVDPDLFKKDDPTGQVRHWAQKVSIAEDGTASLGQAITTYMPCTPGAGQGAPHGIHRYSFILAKMSTPVEPDFQNSPYEDLKDRMGFYLDKYIESKQLEVVAANFMLVSADAKSTVENLVAGGMALADKVLGK